MLHPGASTPRVGLRNGPFCHEHRQNQGENNFRKQVENRREGEGGRQEDRETEREQERELETEIEVETETEEQTTRQKQRLKGRKATETETETDKEMMRQGERERKRDAQQGRGGTVRRRCQGSSREGREQGHLCSRPELRLCSQTQFSPSSSTLPTGPRQGTHRL